MTVFDAHLHSIDPAFPVQADAGYEPPAFTVDEYRAAVRELDVQGGTVVSGSFQGFDQDYLTTALHKLGSGFVGVTQLPADTPDDTILELDRAGVLSVRFNLHRGGSEKLSRLADLGARIHERAGWHVELYADAAELETLRRILLSLPPGSAWITSASAEGRRETLLLAERGVRIKTTGFGRLDVDINALIADMDRAIRTR